MADSTSQVRKRTLTLFKKPEKPVDAKRLFFFRVLKEVTSGIR